MERNLQQAISDASSSGAFKLEDQRITKLPDQLRNLPQIRAITVSGTPLQELPDWLEELPNLRSLGIFRSDLHQFPPVVTRLCGLEGLSFSGTELIEVSPDIDKLTKLRTLVLAGCNLRELPSSLMSLSALELLDLGANLLGEHRDLPIPHCVRHLGLWGNGLSRIPDSLRSVADLRTLILSLAGVSSSDLFLKSTAWRELELGARVIGRGSEEDIGDIREIPDWLFEACPRLTWLDLAGNKIARLPSNIGQLRELVALILPGNQLTDVPHSVWELPNLKIVSLENNALRQLPPLPPRMDRFVYVGLAGNALPIPPEIVDDPHRPLEIWEYLAQIKEDRRPLDEAKVLVVGEGSVGKTSLIRRLVTGEFDLDERKTEGIEVTKWTLPVADSDITINMWDFGGQEIMHATHQFFLTRRSVYLVVLDARQGEEQNRIEYWLKLVNSLSGGSPVILVGNKCEGLRLDIDQRGLRAKYPNIVAILETSCVDNVGLHALKTTLAKTVATLSHVRDVLPRSFFEVKEILERLGADYLPFNEYEGLCVKHGVSTARARELLIGFLHDLGTVLCFRDDPRLRDTNILNPEWVTGGVYRILNSNRAAVQKGLLRWPDLDAILGSVEYPADKRGFIVEMMKKFELCYESEGIFLVPDLLTKEEPDTGSWDDALHFVVKYDVLPSSVIGRLIVRMHQVISRGTVWRTGVVLTFDRNRALVKTDREDGLLTIMVSGAIRGRRGLLTAIRTQLRSIEQTIPGLTCEERVPVSGHGGIWVPYSHLLRLEEAGKRTVVPHGLVDEFEIRELLDGIESRNDRILVRRSSASPASAFDGADEAERADEAVGRSVDDGGEVDGEVDGRAWTPRQAIGLGILCSGILAVAIAAYAIVSRFTDSGVAIAAGAFALAVIAVIAVVVLRTSGRISESTYGLGLKQALSTFGATSRGDRDEDRQ